MIHLTYSNRTEALLDALVARLDARRARVVAGEADPLAPGPIVVPNRNVERYVELGVATRLGIAANLRFERLAGLVERTLGADLLLGDALTARVLRALLDDALLAEPALAPVRRYLAGGGDDPDAIELRRAQLALHVARLFEEYAFSRPDLLEAWSAGEGRFAGTEHARTEAWQRAIFAAARAHPASAGFRTLREAIAARPAAGEPGPAIHVFGLSYVARVFSEVFDALGRQGPLHLYSLNPCEEFWEDLETATELRRRRRTSDREPDWLFEDEDPFRLSVDTETPLLRLWGRPGREHVRLLDALTECDFDAAFVDPLREDAPADDDGDGPLFAGVARPPLLARLQHDVLTRAPRPDAPTPGPRDDSVRILACPSVRREVETVAAEIWAAIEELEGLTFDRIAVLVNGPERDLYLPHVAAVFEEARGIPYNVTDLSLASVSPLVEAALRLIALPGSRFARPDVLGVITHPAVRPPEVEPHAWVALCDRLGIFHGLDRRAHEGTYVGAHDHLSWDQGLRRIALGAFVSGERSGDPRFVEVGGEPLLPEEPAVGDLDDARFCELVRSLASDVAFARQAALPLARWAALFGAMLRAYLRPDEERERAAMRRALGAIERLAELDLDGAPVRYPVAHELAREALEALGGGRGQHLADGVVVSSLMPMRAIPFRVIFVLGLGEGRFPATDRRDALDLRAARRRAGDVTPPERDRYTFLETVLCCRERLVLSYVARDERTGEALAPSAVVTELLEVLEGAHLPEARRRIVRAPRLRRHEEDGLEGVLPGAAAERRAVELGEALREGLAAEGREGLLATLRASETARRAAGNAADQAPLRRALGLAPIPDHAAAVATEPRLRLSLSALRRFLESPLQGWTRVILRIDEDDFESVAAVADEPFEARALDATVALRGAFVDAVLDGSAPEARYAEAIRRLQARGRWPLGPLAGIEAEQHAEVLARWRAAWEALGPPRGTGRLRVGAAHAPDQVEAVLDPIVLRFDDDPRQPGSGRPLLVELSGRTELLRDEGREGAEGRASVLPLLRQRRGARGQLDARRYALRAFFDQVALAASGRPSRHRAVTLLGDRDDGPSVIGLRPLSAEAARGWLRDLARDLLSGPHAYLLPIEAVLRLDPGRDGGLEGDAIVASVEHVRDRLDGGQDRWGPVRDPLVHPPLDPGRAEDVVARRYGPFLRAMEGP